MAIVCQQCGDVGYSCLLIYCCLCNKAARHQYCLNTIPELDEDPEWSCEDCNFRTSKVERVQHLKISNSAVNLSDKENSIINNDLSGDDVHAHEHEIRGWGTTKMRSINAHEHDNARGSKMRSINSHEHEIKGWGTTKTRSINAHEHENARGSKRRSINSHEYEITECGNTKRRSIKSHEHEIKEWGNTRKRSITSVKLPLEAYHDSFRDDESRDDSPQPFERSKPNDGRRKLILLDEDDESRDDSPQPNGRRRILILAHEDDELSNDSTMERKITILRKRITLDLEKNKYSDDMHEFIILDKENEDDNVAVKSLKEAEVSSKHNKMKFFKVDLVLQNTNGEMTTKATSKDGLLQWTSGLPLIVHLNDSIRSPSEFHCILEMPIIWRGWFKICGQAYGPLIARFSPKAGEKAWNATKFLPQVIRLTMVSRSHAWPRSFKMSPPTDDHIALTFFPPDSRVEKMVDQLVQEVIRCDMMLKVVLDFAELLIFPSNLLHENYKRYQCKHYLWGVFKRKDSDTNVGETRISQTYDNSGKQRVPNLSIKSEVQIEGDGEEMPLEGEPKENLCSVTDEGGDTEMGNGRQMKELNGCLELFPTEVENIALGLKKGDGKQGVDLELSLGLPFRR